PSGSGSRRPLPSGKAARPRGPRAGREMSRRSRTTRGPSACAGRRRRLPPAHCAGGELIGRYRNEAWLDPSVPLLGTDHVNPGQTVVQVDRVAVRVQVDRRNIWIGVMPGGVDHDAIDEDVGPAIPGELVGLRVLAVETVCRGGVEDGVDVLGDTGFGVDPS